LRHFLPLFRVVFGAPATTFLELALKELKALVECSFVSRRSSYYIWLNHFHQTFIPFQIVQVDIDAYQSIAVV